LGDDVSKIILSLSIKRLELFEGWEKKVCSYTIDTRINLLNSKFLG
jgi:hypothetical protein